MLTEYKKVLKNYNFKYLWTSQLLSQLTINIMNFTLLLRLFAQTESTIAVSFLWVSYALPAVFFGPIGAATVDMIERRKILMFTNLLQAAVVLVYAIWHPGKPFLIYGVVLAYSFLNQFYVPAEAASLPSLVSAKNLPAANSIFFLTQQATLVLGYGIAGFLYKILGFSTTLYLCTLFLFLAFVSVSFLPTLVVSERIPSGFEKAVVKFFERIYEGYLFIKSNRAIFLPFMLLMGFQIGLAVIMVNIPVFTKDVLQADVEYAGLLVVVPAGLGASIGALLIPRLLAKGWRKKKTIQLSILAMFTALSMCAVAVPLFAVPLRYVVSAVAVMLAGISFVGAAICSQTYLQEATPGGLRGRVFGNFWFLVTSATILPVIFSGTITEILGIKVLLATLALVALAAYFVSRKINVSSLRVKQL